MMIYVYEPSPPYLYVYIAIFFILVMKLLMYVQYINLDISLDLMSDMTIIDKYSIYNIYIYVLYVCLIFVRKKKKYIYYKIHIIPAQGSLGYAFDLEKYYINFVSSLPIIKIRIKDSY